MYEKEIEKLNKKLKWYAENQMLLDKDAEIIKKKDDEIRKLRLKLQELQTEVILIIVHLTFSRINDVYCQFHYSCFTIKCMNILSSNDYAFKKKLLCRLLNVLFITNCILCYDIAFFQLIPVTQICMLNCIIHRFCIIEVHELD